MAAVAGAALAAGLLIGGAATAQDQAQSRSQGRAAAERFVPGIWQYSRQDDLHKATVADLAGFFQVQCRAAKVSLVLLINSEGPLPTAGRSDPVPAQFRFKDKTIPVTLTEQTRYARQSGPIHTAVFLLTVKDRGPEILDAIKKAHAFALDQGSTVSAFSAKGSAAAISDMEKNCVAG